MKKYLLTATVLSALLTGTVAAEEAYKLRSGDQLSIVLTQDPSISTPSSSDTTQYQVRPDGKVSVPYIGAVNASGLTVEEFTNVLTRDFSKYYIDPDVSVNITKLGTTRVYVFGEVNQPGVYELTKGHTVMDAIGAAGSFNWDTGKKKIFLIRQDGNNTIIPINLNYMLKTGDLAENYVMNEGDILYLTRNHRISISRDIAPLFSAAYTISRINKD